ncbi:type II toxin-antitoxin system HipA family toxin, partial [Phocaeicola vulgatus]|nr:type II toxin-antitoxin system HipA family toxin [Phocaeicola vulgatus]
GEEITPLDRLCYVGKRAMGALEFEPSSPINGMTESSVLHNEDLTEHPKSGFTDTIAFHVQLRQERRNI